MRDRPDEDFVQLAEMDPLVLDALLAASFDWKELANRLSASGRTLPREHTGILALPHAVYRMAHTACLTECGFAENLRCELERIHRQSAQRIRALPLKAVCDELQHVDTRNRFAAGGFLWALITDSRRCVRRLSAIFVRHILTGLFGAFYHPVDDRFEKIMGNLTASGTKEV